MPNFSFLACLEVAEKFMGVGGCGGTHGYSVAPEPKLLRVAFS